MNEQQQKQYIGFKMRQAREIIAKLTREQAAEKLNVKVNYIYQVEAGYGGYALSTLNKFAIIYGVQIKYFYDWDSIDEMLRERINNKIGQKIKKHRQEKGWTQQQLAEKIGTTKSYISLVENGKIPYSIELQKKFETALQVTDLSPFSDWSINKPNTPDVEIDHNIANMQILNLFEKDEIEITTKQLTLIRHSNADYYHLIKAFLKNDKNTEELKKCINNLSPKDQKYLEKAFFQYLNEKVDQETPTEPPKSQEQNRQKSARLTKQSSFGGK